MCFVLPAFFGTVFLTFLQGLALLHPKGQHVFAYRPASALLIARRRTRRCVSSRSHVVLALRSTRVFASMPLRVLSFDLHFLFVVRCSAADRQPLCDPATSLLVRRRSLKRGFLHVRYYQSRCFYAPLLIRIEACLVHQRSVNLGLLHVCLLSGRSGSLIRRACNEGLGPNCSVLHELIIGRSHRSIGQF